MTEVKTALTLEQAAAKLGTSSEGLRSRVRRGQVKPLRGAGGQGRPMLFALSEVRRILAQVKPGQDTIERLARVVAGFLSGHIGPMMLYYFKPQPAGVSLFMQAGGQAIARSYSNPSKAFDAAVPRLDAVPPDVLDAARRICARLNVPEVEYVQALLYASQRLPPQKPFDDKTQETLDKALAALRCELPKRPDMFRLFNETLYSFDTKAVRYLLDGRLEKPLPPEKLPCAVKRSYSYCRVRIATVLRQ